MLEARNIEKSYPNLQVLKGIDLSIKKGEIVSIVGASGAGKSTLLQILGTLDRADHGYIELNNVKIESRPRMDLEPVTWYRRLIGNLIDWLIIGILSALVFINVPKVLIFFAQDILIDGI